MWRKIWSVLIVVGVWQGAALGQAGELSRILDRLTQLTGERLEEEDFYPKAKEVLWDVYPQGDSLKPELVDFVKHGADGPRLCFAGLALITFRDPVTVRPMLERAMDGRTSPATRTCFRKAAANLLSMRAGTYGAKGKIDKDSNEFLQELTKDADAAAKSSIGHLQARRVHALIVNSPENINKNLYFSLPLTNQTDNLDGVLDLKDEPLLAAALAFPDPWVFQSMIAVLGYTVNRDFVGELAWRPIREYTPEMERASKAAGAWWQNYLRENPDGDWRPAVIAGFQDAGYKIEKDYGSFRTQQELLRALDDGHPRFRYNAYRLLNEIYKTHFDLDIAFFRGSHNFGSSEYPPDNNIANNEARLKKYWQKRLGH